MFFLLFMPAVNVANCYYGVSPDHLIRVCGCTANLHCNKCSVSSEQRDTDT